jgi:hypothetical protein
MDTNDKNLQERLLSKIRSGELTMRPRAYFVLKVAALVVVALCALVASVFICNFIFFTLRLNGQESLLARPGGLLLFLRFFPWELLLLDILCILVLERLLKHFSFGWRSPVLYLALALLALVVSAGFALDRGTRFNDEFLNRADHDVLPPPFGELYEYAHRPLPPEFRPPLQETHQ